MHWKYAALSRVPALLPHARIYFVRAAKNFHCCACGATNQTWTSAGVVEPLLKKRGDLVRVGPSPRYFSKTAISQGYYLEKLKFWKSEPPAIPPDFPTEPSATVASISPTSDAASLATDAAATSAADVAVNTGIMDAVITSGVVDPPFVEMGLATNWYPNHFVHQLLEWVHLSTDLPWWSTIIIGTLTIRVITLPLYIYTRKYLIKQNNSRDELKKLTDAFNVAKNEDSVMKRMQTRNKLLEFYKETGTGPYRGAFVSLSMSSIFMTSIIAVRQMCAVPVPSLTEGGVLWFTNLAAPDPYYGLPLLTGAVMALTIHVAVQGGTLQGASNYAGLIRKVKYLPIIGMPLVFGSAYCGIYIYWLTTSVLSLGIQGVLRNPAVKEALNFPEVKQQEQSNVGLRETWHNWRAKSYEDTRVRMARKEIVRARKRREKDRKKELKKAPPVTYTIGVDTKPIVHETPDFEREWRPPRPKYIGQEH